MNWISAEDLLSFRRCRRQPYLRHFGPQDQKTSPSDFLLQLRQGRISQRQSVATMNPGPNVGGSYSLDWPELYARALRTLELMEEGTDYIYRGVLMTPLNLPGRPVLVSCPDILVRSPIPPTQPSTLSQNSPTGVSPQAARRPRSQKSPDKSSEGNGTEATGTTSEFLLALLPQSAIAPASHPEARQWLYTPIDIRTSKRVKPDYALVLALHTEVLRMVWGQCDTKAIAILRDQQWHTVSLPTARRQARELLTTFVAAMNSSELPEAYVTRSRCNLCTWQPYCRELARQFHPLTLLPGVNVNTYGTLQEVGIATIAALAETEVETIQHLPGIGPNTARRLINQAKATHHKQAFPFQHFELPKGDVELYFDIEAEPQLNVSYLLGVLAVNRRNPEIQFHAYLAEQPEEEEAVWQQFVALTQTHPLAPIYHFHEFEVHCCRQLASRYGTPKHVLKSILRRMVDIHRIARESVVMPVESYSLKHLAQWMGFCWRQEDAGGAQAVYWYAQWLETGDRRFLDATVTYNEDDCRATYHLKRWLEQWQQKHYGDHHSVNGDALSFQASAS